MRRIMLQYISHYTDRFGYIDGIHMALDGGCKWIQLRMKETSSEDFIRTGKEVRLLCNQYNATLIIDDHVELVKEIGADGVHLGLKDMPLAKARKILGKDIILGGTANTFEDVKMHYLSSANYIGCGPFRFTTTKKGLSPVLGLEGFRGIVSRMREEGINIPIVAIGGITAEDIPSILKTGVTGIALSGTILRAENPVNEMKRIINIIGK